MKNLLRKSVFIMAACVLGVQLSGCAFLGKADDCAAIEDKYDSGKLSKADAKAQMREYQCYMHGIVISG